EGVNEMTNESVPEWEHPDASTFAEPGRRSMTTTHEAPTHGAIRSLIPARIDRLPWSPFHTRMVIALGVAWILDGLEITVAGSVTRVLTEPSTLHLSSPAAGAIASVYLVRGGVGPLVLRHLSDRRGRRKLFTNSLRS